MKYFQQESPSKWTAVGWFTHRLQVALVAMGREMFDEYS